MKYQYLALASLIFLTACGNGTIRSYSLNAAAQRNPIVEASYINHGGRGPIMAKMKSGEVLQGEFTTQATGGSSFGHIYGQAFGRAHGSVSGPGGTAFGSAYGSSTMSGSSFGMWSENSSPGVATLQGNRGTVLDCEYFVNLTSQGAGACKSTRGGLYRIHFE